MAIALAPTTSTRHVRAVLVLAAVIAISAVLATGINALRAPMTPAPVDAAPPAMEFRASVLSEESLARVDAILATPLPDRPAPPPLEPWEDYYARPRPVPAAAAAPASPDIVADEVHRVAGSLPGTAIRPRATGWAAEFISAVGYEARRAGGSDRIPPSVTIAQAILESDWGRSALSTRANNYFGIKAAGRAGTAGSVTMQTMEVANGQAYWVNAPFRAYRSLGDSVADHNLFLFENSRYRPALAVGSDPVAFASALQRAGYATDPRYAVKLVAIMDRYDLYRYDVR